MDAILSTYAEHRVLSLITLTLGIAFLLIWTRRDTLPGIPGPKGWPLIGIGYLLPPRAPRVFRQWAAEHGDAFKIRVGWYDWVVIDTPDAVREILEKQAASTSSKAPAPMSHGIVTGGCRMPTMEYGPEWRALRTILRQVTTVQTTTSFIPSQEFESKNLVFDLLTDNDSQRNFYQHMRRFAFSTIMTNTFGTRVRNWNHPDAQNSVRSQAVLRQISRPRAFLVDELPPLARLPKWLQPGIKDARKAAKVVRDIKMDLWHRIEGQIRSGKAPHCFARQIAENKQSWYAKGLTEEQLAWVSGGIVEAGFETTAGTLNSLILYLAADTKVQDNAQEELMRVVGPDRLPNFSDIANLPYVRACVKEVLRMNPILAPGIRHYCDSDVWYRGQRIPKGTVLLASTAALHFDPTVFDDPFKFKPERYIGYDLYSADYMAMSDCSKRDHCTFSTGRRNCPGARLAENSLNIALSKILWAFEVRPPLNEDQVEGEIDLSEDAYADAGFTLPKPFAARFVPRDNRARIIEDQWDLAQKEGYELRGVTVDVEGMMQ